MNNSVFIDYPIWLVGRKGVRLEEKAGYTTQDEIKLKLISTQSYNGIVEMIYTRR